MNSHEKTTSICLHCGEKFTLTSIELRYYQEKSLATPQCCRKCKNNFKEEETMPKILVNK